MTTTQQVANILKASREARNSDKSLQILYLQRAGMALSEPQIQLFRKLPSMETLRRTRQALQMQGKYPADEAVNEARFTKFKQVRADIQDVEPEKVLENSLPWSKQGEH